MSIIIQHKNILKLSEQELHVLKQFVSKAHNATAFHNIDFIVYYSKYFNLATEVISAYQNNALVACLIISYAGNQKVYLSPFQKSLSTYGGPISLPDFRHLEVALLRRLKKYCFKKGCTAYIKAGPKSDAELFRKSGYITNTIPTSLINLHKTEDDLWMSIENRIRRSIKKAWNEGVSVVKVPYDNFKELTTVYNDLCIRTQLHFESESYYLNLAEIFKNGDVGLSVYYAKLNDKVISAMAVLEFGDTINPWFGGTLTDFVKTGAGSLIYWEIMKDGNKQGFKWFDFLGLDVGPIAFYKRGFGGVDYDVMHATYKPYYMRILNRINKIVNKIK